MKNEENGLFVGLAKLLNGQDVIAIYRDHPEDINFVVLYYPMEVVYATKEYNSAEFELIDWLPANLDKDIIIHKNMIFNINIAREDIEETYDDFLSQHYEMVNLNEEKDKKKKTNIVNLFGE